MADPRKIPPQWRDAAFHPTYTRMLCTILRSSLSETSNPLRIPGLNLAQLETQQSFVSFEVSRALILEAIRRTGCPWLGLELGAMTQVSAHGPLGYAIASSQSINQALETVSRFAALRIRALKFSLVRQPNATELRVGEHFDFAEGRIFILEAVVVMLARMIAFLSGSPQLQVCYQLPYSPPRWADRYSSFLPGRVRFNCDHLSISFPNEVLSLPCLSADPVAFASACRECEQKLALEQGRCSPAQAVRHRLREREGDYPTLELMAREMNVSPRTLMRKLRDEGTSYQELMDEVRKDLAEWYLLESSETVEAIAERLGYVDTSNFSRTFRRWHGISPMKFRQAHMRSDQQ